jgi:diguanylate cyclase (GGDEF)-like protein
MSARQSPSGTKEGTRPRHSRPLERRLILALTTMLLPVVAVAGAGVLTFRSSVATLEDFRDETVGESKPIESVRELLVRADDIGENYVEMDDRAMGRRFKKLSSKIDRGFAELATLSSPQERRVAALARARWKQAFAAARIAASLPSGRYGVKLDEFHDVIDEAGSLVADAYSLNLNQVADEISSLQQRERRQLWTALAILVISSIAAGLLGRRVYRSITTPLALLEKAATQFGSDELSHRISVTGDDELARVSRAFNDMAGKLQRSTDELHSQARHDPLTGLPNRTLFIERMEHAIARSDRSGKNFSVLYLDLDGFKAVNDTFGHEAGDELLATVSKRLRGSLRAEDTAARLGGDEFAVLLEGADLSGAIETARRLTRTFRTTWAITAADVPIAFSIGVAIRQDGEGLDQLLRQADAAMYAAKTSGKGQWKVFGRDLDADVITTAGIES